MSVGRTKGVATCSVILFGRDLETILKIKVDRAEQEFKKGMLNLSVCTFRSLFIHFKVAFGDNNVCTKGRVMFNTCVFNLGRHSLIVSTHIAHGETRKEK